MGSVRATTDAEKLERRGEILDAAGRLLLRARYRDITVAQIASHAGVAKGTVFLYFRSKEDVFLTLAQGLIERWRSSLRSALETAERQEGTVGSAAFVRAVIASLDNELVVDLLAILDDTLEQNVERDRAFEFKVFLKVILTDAGALVERVLPELSPGDGVALLNGLFACVVGAYKTTTQSETIREIARRPGMEMFRRDFDWTLAHLATCYVSGFLASRRGG